MRSAETHPESTDNLTSVGERIFAPARDASQMIIPIRCAIAFASPRTLMPDSDSDDRFPSSKLDRGKIFAKTGLKVGANYARYL
mgnify:CR=1 FL=1